MREKVTVRQWVIVLAVMVSARLFSESIYLEPDAAKRRTVAISKNQGAQSASLYLYAPSSWLIGSSGIIAGDTMLWRAQNVTPNNSTHIYQLVNAYSSQEYVVIYGRLSKTGYGVGSNPWFKATVPSVDIDWADHSGANHEADEDSWVGICPFATNNAQRTQIIIRKPKDDGSLVTGSMTFNFWPTTVVRFLKADGSVLTDGATISDSMTPLTLYVDPIAAGPFTVELKGAVDDEFKRPSDYLSGNVLRVSLELKNSGTIVESPENEDYAQAKASAGGTDQLGMLPMGQGRGDFPDMAYTAPIMVIGTVRPAGAHLSQFEFRWQRLISRRSWFIKNEGAQWSVTRRSKRSDDDTGSSDFYDPTPSEAQSKIYFYDCSALLPADGLGPTLAIGDYIREEKDFTYIVYAKPSGSYGSWIECAKIHVGQVIVTRRGVETGVVANDWVPIENSNQIRTLDTTISETEVRGMVGGTLPIQISSSANY